MKPLFPLIWLAVVTGCAGIEKPVVVPAPAPEAKPTLTEAEAFERLTRILATHPALAGYSVKAQLGKYVWERDRQKEATPDTDANISALAKVIGEVTELSAAKHELRVTFKRSFQNADGTPRTFDMDIKIQPPPSVSGSENSQPKIADPVPS